MTRSLQGKIRRLEKVLKVVKNEAYRLYKEWHGASLKGTMNAIDALKEKSTMWDSEDLARAKTNQRSIEALRKITIDELMKHKKNKETFKEIELHFPDPQTAEDRREWCLYAKKIVLEIESFHSHVMRKNPQPKHGENSKDTRDDRTREEQAWLLEQDKAHRIRKKLIFLSKKLNELGDNPRSEPHKQGKKTGNRKRNSKMHPTAGGEQIPSNPAAVGPYRERQAAIVPYERSSSRAAPKTASRLPAFPKFPSYARK